MSLRECKVCKTLYDDETFIGTTEICHSCRMMLEGTYARIHKYIRDHKKINVSDIERLAKDTGTSPAELQIIIELGWLERDIQTYGGMVSERQKLAEKFAHELQRMIDERKEVYTYGGKVYRRQSRKK